MSGGEHFVTSIKKSVLFVLLCEKWLLFIEEASIYFGVGQNRLAKLASQDGCKFVVLSTLQRCAGHLTSRTDITEAYI